MKNLISAATLALIMVTSPAFAQPDSLDGKVQGTITAPAKGDVEVVANGGHQFIKFGEKFSVDSQAEAEVRHIDGKTGKVTVIGSLARSKGYQVYEVPDNLTVDSTDQIVIYSPLRAEDLANVDLSE